MTAPAIQVRCVNWDAAREQLSAVRRAVFIEEQHVPEELEWDEFDVQAWHVLARSPAGDAIGTGRLVPSCRIGRMAVLRAWRGQGVGSAILNALLRMARERACRTVVLHAQTHALSFYERHGFVAAGDEFMDAGIAHREMSIRL